MVPFHVGFGNRGTRPCRHKPILRPWRRGPSFDWPKCRLGLEPAASSPFPHAECLRVASPSAVWSFVHSPDAGLGVKRCEVEATGACRGHVAGAARSKPSVRAEAPKASPATGRFLVLRIASLNAEWLSCGWVGGASLALGSEYYPESIGLTFPPAVVLI